MGSRFLPNSACTSWSGWQARWVETYSAGAMTPYHFTTWADAELAGQYHDPILEPAVQDLLLKIAQANGNSYAGCWDVVCWNDEAVVIAELKRHKKDRISPTQPRWLEAALLVGSEPQNFLLVEWDLGSEGAAFRRTGGLVIPQISGEEQDLA